LRSLVQESCAVCSVRWHVAEGWRGGGWLRGGGAGARCSLASNGYWSWIREAWGVSPAEVPPCSVHVAAHFKACVRWSFFWSRCSRRLLPAPAVMASAEDSAGDGLETDGVFGKHKRSSGLVCNFPLLRGLLCKMFWTAVLLCLSGRCLYGSRSVLFYYGIIQVLCYQKNF